jgi:hypothetical protein
MARAVVRLATVTAVLALAGCTGDSTPTAKASHAPSPSGVAAGSPDATATPSLESPLTTDPAEMEARYRAALPLFAYDEALPLDITRQPTSTRAGLPREDLEYTSPM